MNPQNAATGMLFALLIWNHGEGGAAMDEKGAMIRKILQYLIEHPEAMDTTEGVRKWWLSRDGVEPETKEVREALDSLVSKNWLIARETTPSPKIYGMNPDCLEEIKNFLLK